MRLRRPLVTLSLVIGTLFAPAMAAESAAPVVTCRGETPTILGTAGDDVVTGTSGDDIIWLGPGNDIAQGLDGDDLICGGPGNDSLRGGPGDDVLIGNEGRDRLRGQHGDDLLVGGRGADRLIGGTGTDRLRGRPNDVCDGGTSNTDREAFGSCGRRTRYPPELLEIVCNDRSLSLTWLEGLHFDDDSITDVFFNLADPFDFDFGSNVWGVCLGSGKYASFTGGSQAARPIVGDLDGDGVSEVLMYDGNAFYRQTEFFWITESGQVRQYRHGSGRRFKLDQQWKIRNNGKFRWAENQCSTNADGDWSVTQTYVSAKPGGILRGESLDELLPEGSTPTSLRIDYQITDRTITETSRISNTHSTLEQALAAGEVDTSASIC